MECCIQKPLSEAVHLACKSRPLLCQSDFFQARVKCFILTLTSSSKVSDFRELGFSESRTVDAQRKGFLIMLHSSRMSLKKTYTFLFEVGSVCVCQSSLMNGWADFCLECFLLSQSPVACSVTWRMCMSSSL